MIGKLHYWQTSRKVSTIDPDAKRYHLTRTASAESLLAYLAGPALTLAVLLASMAWCGIFPFGDHAFLSRDGAIQYVGFYGWYHNVLAGQANLTYSLSKGMGGATFGLFAYYLSSPLALLTAFFEPADSAELFSILVPIKLTLASFTCGYALIQRVGRRSAALSLLGCAYALSAYSFTDGSNVMWLDGMALAPLAALGVFRLVRGGRPIMLFASCAAAIVCNWYVGYMVCLFSVVWFLAEMLLRSDCGSSTGNHASSKAHSDPPRASLCIARFAATMALAVGAGCVILLPVAIEQLQSAGLGGNSDFLATLAEGVGCLDARQFLLALVDPDAPFAGATNAVAVPWVLIVLAVSFFALPTAGGLRRKIVLAAVLLVFAISFLVKPFDMVWTGFVRADSYNPRYYFAFLFATCLCAAWAVDGIMNCIKLSGSRMGEQDETPSPSGPSKPAPRHRTARESAVTAMLGVALAAGAGFLAVHGLSQTDLNGYSSNSVSQYREYMEKLTGVHKEAENDANADVVRMENAASSSVAAMRTTEPASSVDALSDMMTTGEYLALGDSSLSHYSSTADGSMKELLGNLGYCLLPGSRGITTYHSPVYLTDSLLGVEYVLANIEPTGCSAVSDEVELPSLKESSSRLYRNEGSLGWGFAVPETAENVEWSGDPFENQERFASALSGEDASSLYADAKVEALELAAESDKTACTWKVTPEQDGPLYLWIAAAPAGAKVSCNGKFLQTTRSYESDTNLMYLGNFKAGSTVIVRLAPSLSFECDGADLDARSLNIERATQMLDRMREARFVPDALEDGRIEGMCAVPVGKKLLISIPATSGWSAKVDGEPAEIESLNGLILLDTGEGEHEIALSYSTPGLSAGIAVSVASLLAFALCLAAQRKKHEKR